MIWSLKLWSDGGKNSLESQYFKKLGRDLLALDVKQITDSIEQEVLFDLEVTE